MKLRAAQIQNYRSIVDSGIVYITNRVTVVIGKNEQGKTNFLKALSSFNTENKYNPNDLPNHLRASLEKKKSEIPIVSLWLNPSESDQDTLKEIIPNINDIKEFKITRYYDGHYLYRAINSEDHEIDVKFSEPDTTSIVESIRKEAESLKMKLETHATRLATFASSKIQAENHIDQFTGSNFTDLTTIDNLLKTFLTALKGLPDRMPQFKEI